MKGTHSVEKLIEWLRYSNLSDTAKVTLIHKLRKMADLCSATGKHGRIDLKEKDEITMTLRIYDDGSLIVGTPVKPDGTILGQLLPPPERDM